jgi:hypothetical protein
VRQPPACLYRRWDRRQPAETGCAQVAFPPFAQQESGTRESLVRESGRPQSRCAGENADGTGRTGGARVRNAPVPLIDDGDAVRLEPVHKHTEFW